MKHPYDGTWGGPNRDPRHCRECHNYFEEAKTHWNEFPTSRVHRDIQRMEKENHEKIHGKTERKADLVQLIRDWLDEQNKDAHIDEHGNLFKNREKRGRIGGKVYGDLTVLDPGDPEFFNKLSDLIK